MAVGRRWAARNNLAASGGGGVGGGSSSAVLLSILPGGPTTAQIANPAGLTDTRGNAVSCARSTANFARKSLTFDPANLIQNTENFAASSWAKIASGTLPTVSQNDSTVMAPDGTQSAAKVVMAAQPISNFSLLRAAFTIPSATTCTFSAYVYFTSPTTIYISADSVTYSSWNVPANTWTRLSDTRPSGTSAVADIGWNVAGVTPPSVTFWVWGAKYEQAASATAYVSPMLVSIGANIPRVEPEGLLVEGAATNVCIRSQEFDNAAWTASTVVVTADQSIAPDSTLTGDQLAFASGASLITGTNAVASASDYTASIYARAVSGAGVVSLKIRDTTAGSDLATLSLGALTTQWQRFSVNIGANATAGNNLAIRLTCSGAVTIYAWGAQLEAGKKATSYIQTAGASLNRPYEALSKALNGPGVFNAALGTIMATINPQWTGGGPNGTYFLSTAFNSLLYQPQTSSPIIAITGSGGSVASPGGAFIAGTPQNYTAKWNSANNVVSLGLTGGATNTQTFTGLTNTSGPVLIGTSGLVDCYWIEDILITASA